MKKPRRKIDEVSSLISISLEQSLFHDRFDANGHCDTRADHRVVPHADEPHHFDVGGHRRGTGKLGVGVHPAHRVGHSVRRGASGHIVRVQRSTGTATGGDGEELFVQLPTFLLIGRHDRVLEPRRVGAVAGDRDVDRFVMHDRDTFAYVVGTITLDGGSFTIAVRFFPDDLQLARCEVVLRLHVGKAVDTLDDMSGVFAKSVQDDPKRIGSSFIGRTGQADRSLGGRERFVTGTESEAVGLFEQKHRGQIAVADTDFSLVGDRAGDAEALEAFAERSGDFRRFSLAFFYRDGRADGICPTGVFKRDRLNFFGNGIGIYAFFFTDFPGVFRSLHVVLLQQFGDLRDTTFVSFKKWHYFDSLLMTGVDCLGRVGETAVSSGRFFERFSRVHTLGRNIFEHDTDFDKFIADNFVVVVESQLRDIPFGRFEITSTLGACAVHRAGHTAKAFAQIFQGRTNLKSTFAEGRLGSTVGDLQEQFPHCRVDRVADQVGVERFEDRLAGQDFTGHRSRVGHPGAAERFDQRFFDDSFFDVEGQLASALLRRTPTDTVCKARDVADLFRLDPFTFLGNGCRAIFWATIDADHFPDFRRIIHELLLHEFQMGGETF
jgi:hypothetical protein